MSVYFVINKYLLDANCVCADGKISFRGSELNDGSGTICAVVRPISFSLVITTKIVHLVEIHSTTVYLHGFVT